MTIKLTSLRRIFVLVAALWFAGYANTTVICANTCPDCIAMSATANSCSATCAAVSVPTQTTVALPFAKPAKENTDFAAVYTSIYAAHIWKPPRQVATSSFEFVI